MDSTGGIGDCGFYICLCDDAICEDYLEELVKNLKLKLNSGDRESYLEFLGGYLWVGTDKTCHGHIDNKKGNLIRFLKSVLKRLEKK